MTFRLTTILELMLVAAACLSWFIYLPNSVPYLLLISTYASARFVFRALQQGETRLIKLAKIGGFWGVVPVLTLCICVVAFVFFRASDPRATAWIGFLFFWGGLFYSVVAVVAGFLVAIGARIFHKLCGRREERLPSDNNTEDLAANSKIDY